MSTVKQKLEIPIKYRGRRLDQTLAELLPEYSRACIQNRIRRGDILIDGKKWKPKDKVKGGERAVIEAELIDETAAEPEAIALSIAYEDDDILVINKPAGMVVHPGAGNRNHTLLNALLHYHPPLKKLPRSGIVHRLDKDTSGLLLVAKTLPALTILVRMMEKRRIKREYRALVWGELTGGGKIDAPIGRHRTQRIKMAVTESGRPAVTHYRILKRFPYLTYVNVQLETGRTHQIRVHFASIHHPLVGDPVYTRARNLPIEANKNLTAALKQFKRQALHAYHLRFTHPITKKEIDIEIENPEDMKKLLQNCHR